jgi:hypothetical protein
MKRTIICLIIIQFLLIALGMLEIYLGNILIGRFLITINVLGILLNMKNLIENY